jgi:hypothetical protein
MCMNTKYECNDLEIFILVVVKSALRADYVLRKTVSQISGILWEEFL